MRGKSFISPLLHLLYLLIPIGCLLFSRLGYSLSFSPPIFFVLAAYALITFVACIPSACLPPSILHRISTALLPLSASIFCIVLLWNTPSCSFLILPGLALWAALFLYLFRTLPADYRILAENLYAFSLLAVFLLGSMILFASQMIPITLDSRTSPNQQYMAALIYIDQGATGESTHVSVTQPHTQRNFFFATMEKTPYHIHLRRGSEPALLWLDDHTLQIGDTAYPIP